VKHLRWSRASDWIGAPRGFGGYGGRLPENGVDVMINPDWWMVHDKSDVTIVNRLYLYGVLELGNENDHHLKANIILISGLHGALIVGFSDEPVLTNVLISLTGDHDSKDMPLSSKVNLGSKALGVFGRLQMYGKTHKIHWTRIEKTVAKGDNSITLEDPVDWEAGDEIAITTSSFVPEEVEKFVIKEVEEDGKKLTLIQPAKYKHSAFKTQINNYKVKMSAKVGLITRNIKIEGANEPARTWEDQSFGCRVLVGQYPGKDGIPYRGRAEISEVQFSHCGQYGWTESYDPRYVFLSRHRTSKRRLFISLSRIYSIIH